MKQGRALDDPQLPGGSPMEITQQVRDYAAKHGLDSEEAVTEGMSEKSEEFKKEGGEIYS